MSTISKNYVWKSKWTYQTKRHFCTFMFVGQGTFKWLGATCLNFSALSDFATSLFTYSKTYRCVSVPVSSVWPFLWTNLQHKIVLQYSHRAQKLRQTGLYHADITLRSGVWLISKLVRNSPWDKRFCWNMHYNFLTWQVNATLTMCWSVGDETDFIMLRGVCAIFDLYYTTVHRSPLCWCDRCWHHAWTEHQ